jgi:hypothetical protein
MDFSLYDVSQDGFKIARFRKTLLLRSASSKVLLTAERKSFRDAVMVY